MFAGHNYCESLNFLLTSLQWLFELPGPVNDFVGIMRPPRSPVHDIESEHIYGFYTLMLENVFAAATVLSKEECVEQRVAPNK
ncbi:hypothetical protein SUGI_0769420 [Cryptomeria japonica]|nr:hypothetical protein SUGI_0769420 [Cryptomeria japonica]